MMKELLALVLGYLLGSINPAFILGKILRGIDIRKHGTFNAGTMNTKEVLGITPAVVVALYDLAKGILAIVIAQKLGAQFPANYLAGIFAILGHIFPFYLQFRGGQGVATAVGLVFWFSFQLFSGGALAESFWWALVSLGILAFVLWWVCPQGELIGLVVVPALALFLLLDAKREAEFYFLLALLLFIWAVNLRNIALSNLLRLDAKIKKEILHWRSLLRPLATLFIFLNFYHHLWALRLAGILALGFGLLDVVRLLSQKTNLFFFRRLKGFLKPKEKRTFSSMSYFLVAIFLLLLLFEKDIASLAILFLIFGDLAGKFYGLIYG
ncbi:glycerol-3-phosphate acyltransferase, partial [bacterium]|nr:glycerol-3-phosphate acyltransferase [bacterium]